MAFRQGEATDTWTGFRNGGNSGAAARNLPRVWSPEKGIAWKADLPGYGQSAPVVWKNRVFLTAIEGANKERNVIVCLDARSGKPVWQKALPSSMPVEAVYTVARAAPTPAIDGENLYAFFESGDMVALSHRGEVRWERSLSKEYGRFQNGHGIGSSPAQTADSLVILIDDRPPGASYLLALDKKTGRNRWKTEREPRGSWASPTLARLGGRETVVVSANGSAQGYDRADGSLLWTQSGLSGNNIPSAAVAGDRIYIGASASRQASSGLTAKESNCCLKVVEANGKPGVEMVWKSENALCDYMSPLVYRNCAYYVNGTGILFCLDAETGKEQYAERIDGSCWASPLASENGIYFFGKNGATTVVEAGPVFRKRATNRLWNPDNPPRTGLDFSRKTPNPDGSPPAPIADQYLDPIVYGVAATTGALYLRTGTQLYGIRG